MRSARQQALDADLRADWNALLVARSRFSSLRDHEELGPFVDYYLGYVDWRLSSLAYVVLGPTGQVPWLARAVDELQRATSSDPAFGEAHALLATCAVVLANVDKARLKTLMPVVKPAWAAALQHSADSPRVQMLRAMSEVFAPPEHGGDPVRGIERWQSAIKLFEKEQGSPRRALDPDWGQAEAWAWLGGAYLWRGRPADAVPALQRALTLKPDFWWATAALAQAKRPQP